MPWSKPTRLGTIHFIGLDSEDGYSGVALGFLQMLEVLVDRRAPHPEHVRDVVRRALAAERAFRVQRLDELAPVFAREPVQPDLALAQPAVQERVDALLPVVAEQLVGLRDDARALDEEVERRAYLVETRGHDETPYRHDGLPITHFSNMKMH